MLVCSEYTAPCAPQNLRSVHANTGDIDIGANASAEGGDEELEDGAEIVNNIVYSFRLNSTGFEKKDYLKYLKGRRSNLIPLYLFFFDQRIFPRQAT